MSLAAPHGSGLPNTMSDRLPFLPPPSFASRCTLPKMMTRRSCSTPPLAVPPHLRCGTRRRGVEHDETLWLEPTCMTSRGLRTGQVGGSLRLRCKGRGSQQCGGRREEDKCEDGRFIRFGLGVGLTMRQCAGCCCESGVYLSERRGSWGRMRAHVGASRAGATARLEWVEQSGMLDARAWPCAGAWSTAMSSLAPCRGSSGRGELGTVHC